MNKPTPEDVRNNLKFWREKAAMYEEAMQAAKKEVAWWENLPPAPKGEGELREALQAICDLLDKPEYLPSSNHFQAWKIAKEALAAQPQKQEPPALFSAGYWDQPGARRFLEGKQEPEGDTWEKIGEALLTWSAEPFDGFVDALHHVQPIVKRAKALNEQKPVDVGEIKYNAGFVAGVRRWEVSSKEALAYILTKQYEIYEPLRNTVVGVNAIKEAFETYLGVKEPPPPF